MLGSWRLAKRTSPSPLDTSPDRKPRVSIKNDTAQGTAAQPSLDNPVAPALHTPHDAVLAEFYSHDLSQGNHADDGNSLEDKKLAPAIVSAGSLVRSTQTASASALRSSTSSPTPAPEPVYDPFSGSLAGLMTPPAALDHTKDELWAHLSRIRELQSEIAAMHMQMEGIGTSDARAAKLAHGTMASAEDWESAGEAEGQRKAARDAEFTQLAETFNKRREAIDGIMFKLDRLSEAVTTFHALPTPAMDFAASRSNTKDTVATSADSPIPSQHETAHSRTFAPEVPDNSTSNPP